MSFKPAVDRKVATWSAFYFKPMTKRDRLLRGFSQKRSYVRHNGIFYPLDYQFACRSAASEADQVDPTRYLIVKVMLFQVHHRSPKYFLLFCGVDANHRADKVISQAIANFNKNQSVPILHNQINFSQPAMVVAADPL
jgi:hypothetical protein